MVVVAIALLPFLGRSFLPPFNEGSLTVGLVSPLGTPLADGDALGREVEKTLLAFPEVVSTSRRTGRAEKDEHVQGVNASEMEVVLRPGRPKEELLAEMRKAVAMIPGVSVSFGQPISHRIDHMISGSKTNLAVKIFGPDLAVLRGLAADAEARLRKVASLVDLSNQEQATVPQLLIDFDREAMARHGVTPADLARSVEALFQGTTAGEIVEGGLTSRSRGALSGVLACGPRAPRRAARHHGRRRRRPARRAWRGSGSTSGPGWCGARTCSGVAMLTANVAGADLTGTVEKARAAHRGAVPLPEGYQIVFGGQFEEAARSMRNLTLPGRGRPGRHVRPAVRRVPQPRHAVIILVNLPLALIGGVLAVAWAAAS